MYQGINRPCTLKMINKLVLFVINIQSGKIMKKKEGGCNPAVRVTAHYNFRVSGDVVIIVKSGHFIHSERRYHDDLSSFKLIDIFDNILCFMLTVFAIYTEIHK